MTGRTSIALLGFYNIENAGDERMRFVLCRLFRDADVSVFRLDSVPMDVLSFYDWIIIGGGSLLHAGWPLCNPDWVRRLPRTKLGVVGIGATRTIDSRSRRAIDALIERASFFYARDRYTAEEVCGGRVRLAPDISFFAPISAEQAPHRFDVALSLAPCPWRKEFSAKRWVDALSGLRVIPWPLYFHDARDPDLLAKAGLPTSQSEFSLRPAHESVAILAARFHATVFALQLRKPFLSINYAPKVADLLKDVGLDDLCLEVDDTVGGRRKLDAILSDPSGMSERLDLIACRLEAEACRAAEEIRRIVLASKAQPDVAGFGRRAIGRLRRVFN